MKQRKFKWTKRTTRKLISYLCLTLMSLIVIFPLYIMFVGSFKTSSDLAANSWGLPNPFTLNNYYRLLSYNGGKIIRTYANSIFITFSYTVLTIIFSGLAAYAFSKMKFKGRNVLFVFLLATMMLPFELETTPLYIIFSKIKWLNTYQIQIIPFTANVFALYMMKNYMDGIPDSLIESAELDGAGQLRIWAQIMMPVAKPCVSSTIVLVALSKFNDYLWPRLTITNQDYMPIMTILPTLSDKDVAWALPRELLLTGCTVVIVPLIILFVFMQDAFMNSVTIGAVKE
jgi:ABC-type glycerol-3-phosphate transport system permease component